MASTFMNKTFSLLEELNVATTSKKSAKSTNPMSNDNKNVTKINIDDNKNDSKINNKAKKPLINFSSSPNNVSKTQPEGLKNNMRGPKTINVSNFGGNPIRKGGKINKSNKSVTNEAKCKKITIMSKTQDKVKSQHTAHKAPRPPPAKPEVGPEVTIIQQKKPTTKQNMKTLPPELTSLQPGVTPQQPDDDNPEPEVTSLRPEVTSQKQEMTRFSPRTTRFTPRTTKNNQEIPIYIPQIVNGHPHTQQTDPRQQHTASTTPPSQEVPPFIPRRAINLLPPDWRRTPYKRQITESSLPNSKAISETAANPPSHPTGPPNDDLGWTTVKSKDRMKNNKPTNNPHETYINNPPKIQANSGPLSSKQKQNGLPHSTTSRDYSQSQALHAQSPAYEAVFPTLNRGIELYQKKDLTFHPSNNNPMAKTYANITRGGLDRNTYGGQDGMARGPAPSPSPLTDPDALTRTVQLIRDGSGIEDETNGPGGITNTQDHASIRERFNRTVPYYLTRVLNNFHNDSSLILSTTDANLNLYVFPRQALRDLLTINNLWHSIYKILYLWNRRYIVLQFMNPIAKQIFLNNQQLLYGRYLINIDANRPTQIKGSIHNCTINFQQTDLQSLLRPFGTITRFNYRMESYGDATVLINTADFDITLHKDISPLSIPALINFQESPLAITLRNVPPQCFSCARRGHIARNCTATPCNSCRARHPPEQNCTPRGRIRDITTEMGYKEDNATSSKPTQTTSTRTSPLDPLPKEVYLKPTPRSSLSYQHQLTNAEMTHIKDSAHRQTPMGYKPSTSSDHLPARLQANNKTNNTWHDSRSSEDSPTELSEGEQMDLQTTASHTKKRKHTRKSSQSTSEPSNGSNGHKSPALRPPNNSYLINKPKEKRVKKAASPESSSLVKTRQPVPTRTSEEPMIPANTEKTPEINKDPQVQILDTAEGLSDNGCRDPTPEALDRPSNNDGPTPQILKHQRAEHANNPPTDRLPDTNNYKETPSDRENPEIATEATEESLRNGDRHLSWSDQPPTDTEDSDQTQDSDRNCDIFRSDESEYNIDSGSDFGPFLFRDMP